MADVTVCVMLPPRGDMTFARSAHTKMPVLTIVDIFPLTSIEEATAPVTGYIHVTGCPKEINAKVLAARLCQAWDEWTHDEDAVEVLWTDGKRIVKTNVTPEESANPPKPTSNRTWQILGRTNVSIPKFEYRGKRLWKGDVNGIPARGRQELLRTRQLTITWDEFIDAFMRQDTNESVRQELTARGLR